MTHSCFERLFSHIRIEITSKLVRESAVENMWAMSASLTPESFVRDEGPACKPLSVNKIMIQI